MNPASRLTLNSTLKMINIRTAKLDDIPQLVVLLKALFAIEADFDFDPDKQARGLQLLLRSNQGCILVAESTDDKNLRGMCSIQTLISTAEGDAVGLLEDLVVAADFRNQGIGAKLLAEAGAWAERQGLKRLQLLADKNNSPALKFYEKQGWQSTQLVCLKRPLKKLIQSSEP
jgi:ribosomal protein S18 acetylase RimI-like enzyme